MNCPVCGHSMEAGARFCSSCGQAVTSTPPPFSAVPRASLVRPREGRMIAGVCAGFALAYGWDVSLVRIVLLVALFFGVGTPLLAYLIAWIVMPNAQYKLPQETSIASQ